MVVEPGQDLAVGAVGDRVVGEVGLPHLVGLVGLEPRTRRPGSFRRLGCDQPGLDQLTADRRGRGKDPVLGLQMPADGVRAGLQPCAVNRRRSASISSTVAAGVPPGLVLGRRERGCGPPTRLL
jgi:hypothetical protein